MSLRNIGPALLLALAACLSPAALAGPAQASYPDRIVKIVVPFAPGGGTDVIARTLAQEMAKDLGASIIIENKPGAGTIIGTQAVATAEPDGYTLLMGTFANAVNPSLYAKLSYDQHRDLASVALIARSFSIVVVNTKSPINSIKDLIAAAKAEPDKLSYGTYGTGTSAHLSGELFKHMAGVNLTTVPYKGSAPAITDLIGGQIQIMFDPLQSVLSNVQGGKIRALAVSGKARSPVVPDVPTIAESGYDGFETTAWWGVFAPAKLPEALSASLVAEIERIAASEGFRGKLEPLGVTAVAGLGGAKFAEFQKSEIAKWGRAVQDAQVKIE
jgi:tripartite-type tricarboxylate transporter receptor subunit TctC